MIKQESNLPGGVSYSRVSNLDMGGSRILLFCLIIHRVTGINRPPPPHTHTLNHPIKLHRLVMCLSCVYVWKSSQFQLFYVKTSRRMDIVPDKDLLDFLRGVDKHEDEEAGRSKMSIAANEIEEKETCVWLDIEDALNNLTQNVY